MPTLPLMEQIASDEILVDAFDWLCHQRRDYSHNNDVWEIRRHWEAIKPQLQNELLAGTYHLSPQQEIRLENDTLEMWSALDSLVLKAVSIILTRYLGSRLSGSCHHLAGNGGSKKAVRRIWNQMNNFKFVLRSDVKKYYASIDHHILYDQLHQTIDDPQVLRLLWDYLKRTVHFGGWYSDVKRGISLGCPLSPLMGALYLKPLDDRMAKAGYCYARFMDDWVILLPTRWKLREAVRVVNQTMTELKLEKHPDKTYIGKTEKGFDFLGYRFEPQGLGLALGTLKRFQERLARLYEQGADEHRIGQCVRRFQGWATSA
jgi:RNA-directed DNA polymerase